MRRITLLAACLSVGTGCVLAQARPTIPVRTVVFARPQTPVEAKAIEMLREESAVHSSVPLEFATQMPLRQDTPVILIATRPQVSTLLPANLQSEWQRTLSQLQPSSAAEGYLVAPLRSIGTPFVVIAGNDARGELFAIGWFLRQLAENNMAAFGTKAFFTAPEKLVRGYQIGYRMKNNTYDAWTLPQFEQQLRDLAVFGMNTMQVVAPVSDDALTSPLYPAPALETVIGLSRMSAAYGLRFDLYYPELRKDYGRTQDLDDELKDFEALVRQLPLVDSLHIPGGDPGRTPPELLFPLVQREAEILHRYHPGATIWISGQGFDAQRYETFYRLLQEKPSWLAGVFFGPQSRDGLPVQRQRIPREIALEFYPDIAHTMHAQFPVPQWDPIFALTEGREPICPRPAGFAAIYRHFASLHSGFMLYSEGVNDDVNKFLWAQWGWSSVSSAHQTLTQYARYFLHASSAQVAEQTASDIEDLERNWNGPLLANSHISETLAKLRRIPQPAESGWRWKSLLYRAVYDAYVQQKRKREAAVEQEAYAALAGSGSSEEIANRARATLASSTPSATEVELHRQLFQLADELFHEAGLQLSVSRYQASNWERGANLDRADTPLNDRGWIESEIGKALQQASEEERIQHLHQLAQSTTAQAGTLYDDLGNPAAEPHLVRGKGWEQDPELYETAIDGIADQTLEHGWKLGWLSYAETLYETPLRLHYDQLQTGCPYRLRVVYGGEDYHLPMRLTANGSTELQPYRLRATNPEVVEYDLSQALTMHGELDLAWNRPAGAGGGGRGGQVAEVWLIPCKATK